MSAGITSLELDLEAQGPIENTSAFHLLEALEDLNDEDLARMHAKLTKEKPLPKPMPAAAAGSRSRKPAAAARPARPAPPVRRVSTSRSPSPPPSGRGGRGGRGRGAPSSRGRGVARVGANVPAEGARGRGRGGRGGDRGRGSQRGGRGGASGAENKKPVNKPLFAKPLRPPGNIWKLTFAEIMRSDTILGEIVHRLYVVEKAKLDAEVAAKKAEEERQRQKELAEKLLEQKRKEEEARERAKFVTPAATSAPTEWKENDEAKEKEEGGEEKKRRRRQGKKPAADAAKAAPDVSNVKVDEKLDVGKYLADLKRRLESGELTKYEYEEQAKAIASATQEPEPSKEAQRPNYFIGVRCKTQQVRDAAAELQQRAVGLCGELADSVVPTQRLHVTLVMLPLHTPEALKQANKLMHGSVQALIKEHYPEGKMRLTFDRVGHFTNRVLWIGASADDDREKFLAFRGALEKLFVEAKLATEDDEYKIHGTLLKGNTRIPDSVVEELACVACGTETFDFVELMQVGKYDRSGNYVAATTCNVRPMTEEEERTVIGEQIYTTISEETPDDAGKITGMILDAGSLEELRALQSDAALLKARVIEARSVLHHAEEEAAAAAKKQSRADDTASVVSDMSEAARSDMRSDVPGYDGGRQEVNFEEYLSTLSAKGGLPASLRLLPPRQVGEARSKYPDDELDYAVSRPVSQWPATFRGPPVRVRSPYPYISKVQTTFGLRRKPALVVDQEPIM